MSLGIPVDDVIKVLLPDGWHDVTEHSFDIAVYEYKVLLQGTLVSIGEEDPVTEYGFIFTDTADGAEVAGPVTSIMALKLIRRDREAGQ